MKVVCSIDKDFDFKQCENLYRTNIKSMGNICTFSDIVNNSHFYSFYEKSILKGCIYITYEESKLFLNGFSVRKNHLDNILAITKISDLYSCDIWTKTKNKTAIFLLKKCGFEYQYIKNNLTYLKKER